MVLFRYCFNLLEAPPLDLDAPIAATGGGEDVRLRDVVGDSDLVEARAIVQEAAAEALRDLTPRQQQALLAYAQPGATLTSVSALLGCSKSTVENEVRRGLTVISQYSSGADEAAQVYDLVLERLNAAQ
jgi:DNA-directed RNA polymerase specialized sigma24 family protein